MARRAAEGAANAVKEQSLTRDDVEEIVEKGITRFMERCGIDDVPEFRKDLTAMRAARETREAVMRHGLGSVIAILIMGIATAIWLAVKGAK